MRYDEPDADGNPLLANAPVETFTPNSFGGPSSIVAAGRFGAVWSPRFELLWFRIARSGQEGGNVVSVNQ